MRPYTENCEFSLPLRGLFTAGLLTVLTPVVLGAGGEHDFGVTAAVYGEVRLTNSGGDGIVGSGIAVHPGSNLNTGPDSGLQVLFSDGSVLTLGSDTEASILEYTFDPATDEGKLTVSIPDGSYRIVTGRIAEKTPRTVSLVVPHGRVELLGTIVAGDSDSDGESTVVLVGPGARRLSADKQGAFAFIPQGAAVQTGENEITVFRAGFAVTVDQDGNVSEPFEMSGREFGQMVASLARQKGGGDGEDDLGDGEDALGDGGSSGDGDDGLLAVEGDLDGLVEEGDQDDSAVDVDEGGDLAALREAQEITEIADLEDIAGLKGLFTETDIEMDSGGVFDYRFEFGSVESAKLDFIGFENIQTGDITDGELSWDVMIDGDPTFDEFDLSSEDGTLTEKDCGPCTGTIAVLNAGQGNVAKFHLLQLDTGDDTFEDKIVKPGGNNNFPGSD